MSGKRSIRNLTRIYPMEDIFALRSSRGCAGAVFKSAMSSTLLILVRWVPWSSHYVFKSPSYFHSMYLLSCPNCQSELPVTPAKAGEQLECPDCSVLVDVPNLGALRKLPRSESSAEGADSSTKVSSNPGATIAFAALSAIALAALLMAGYTGIRWAMIDASENTEIFLEQMDEEYKRIDAAVLIREFEDMEKFSLDLISPYKFHEVVLEKRRWGWNTVLAGIVAAVCGCGGLFSVSRGKSGSA